jgi:hypothetical protein
MLVMKVWKIGGGIIGFCAAMYNTIAKEMLVRLLLLSSRFSSFSNYSNIIMLTSLEAKMIQECKYLKYLPTFWDQDNIYEEDKFKYS